MNYQLQRATFADIYIMDYDINKRGKEGKIKTKTTKSIKKVPYKKGTRKANKKREKESKSESAA